ncbi:MAG: hypothetical protein L3K15_04105 [Thermoplasmata archaeon]|nr:hypothetical protein [Thermoplasmata archaeon]
MRGRSTPQVPSSLLGTIALYAVLAGGLSIVEPYFIGLTGTLAAIGAVVWAVRRPGRSVAGSAPPQWGRRPWLLALPATAGGWVVALGAQGPWALGRGPALALACIALWLSRRSGTMRSAGGP